MPPTQDASTALKTALDNCSTDDSAARAVVNAAAAIVFELAAIRTDLDNIKSAIVSQSQP